MTVDTFCSIYGDSFYPILEQIQADDERKRTKRQWGWPLDIQSEPLVFQGTTACTVMHGSRANRFIDITEQSKNILPVSWGELSRYALKDSGSPKYKARWFPPSKRDDVKIPSVPLFMGEHVAQERVGRFVYVDISRCYSQLVGKLDGPAVVYDPESQRFGSFVDWQWKDRSVFDAKYVGRAMVGMMRKREMSFMRYGKFYTSKNERLFAPQVPRWVVDVCHAVAGEAISKFGCLRWHTDGGIFPTEIGWDFHRYLSEWWGIESTIKYEGYGHVSDLNTFKIGRYQTERYSKDARGEDSMEDEYDRHPRSVDGVDHTVDAGWLRETVVAPWERLLTPGGPSSTMVSGWQGATENGDEPMGIKSTVTVEAAEVEVPKREWGRAAELREFLPTLDENYNSVDAEKDVPFFVLELDNKDEAVDYGNSFKNLVQGDPDYTESGLALEVVVKDATLSVRLRARRKASEGKTFGRKPTE